MIGASSAKFTQVEIDATGGSNYVLLGTSEMLSVPYALYAEKSGNQLNAGNGIAITNDTVTNTGDLSSTNELQTLSLSNDTVFLSNGGFVKIPKIGKSVLVLVGDITDAQAAIKIAEEAGSITQEVLIANCSNLTTVDLSAITHLYKLTIGSNPSLVNVNLGQLISCDADFIVNNNATLNSLNLASLTELSSGSFFIFNNASLPSLNLPSLTKVNSLFSVKSNSSLTSLNVPVLSRFLYSVNIDGNPISSLVFPSLTQALNLNFMGNSLTSVSCNVLATASNISLSLSPNLTTVNFPLLITSVIDVSYCNLTTLGLGNFTMGTIGIHGTSIVNINLPLFTSGGISFTENQSLTTLSLPSLTSITGYFALDENSLTSISIPSLTSLSATNGAMLFMGNNFPSSQIDYILNKLVNCTISPLTYSIYLDGQTPAAPPTGQGIIDKNLLISNGYNIITD